MKVNCANVLLVDDREENLFSLEQLLSEIDLEVNFLKSTSGEDALKIVAENEIALIMLDVKMPVMDGYALASILKEDEKSCHIPIIFVTASNKEENHVVNGYKTGAIDYLLKPLNSYITKCKVEGFIKLYLLNKHLEKTALELKSLNNDLEELANMTSYDLQAPIRTISYSAQHLEYKYRGKLDQEAEDIIHNIKVGSRRMKTLIDKLLNSKEVKTK